MYLGKIGEIFHIYEKISTYLRNMYIRIGRNFHKIFVFLKLILSISLWSNFFEQQNLLKSLERDIYKTNF